MSNLYGLIGKTLSHSFSKKYFTEKFERENIPNSRYELFELPSIDDFPKLIAENPSLRGLNVTIPYKEAVIPFLDELSPAAERIGAVNVIAFSGNRLIGHNSDYIGFKHSLKNFIPSQALKALVLGTGGASKAVCVALEDLHIPYLLVSRTAHHSTIAYKQIDLSIMRSHQLIINTTPLGMYPNINTFPMIPYEWLTEQHYLYDLVYNPSETIFLQKGKEKKAKTMGGLAMLYAQAEEAWKIWQNSSMK
ncbi:MAG: shikimate dehydrogenase [Flammeovirgaceae bacterium]|nr:shikimate dehydrogenase [Flammeovirgaceae bacterium]MDW8287847.1 shikimate dehydrogenase [Flammeovirgaceae bacterium]